MEKSHFEVVIATRKKNKEGKVNKVREKYLAEAVSFTDAEAKTIKHLKGCEFQILNITPKQIDEIILRDGGMYFELVVEFEDIDSKMIKSKFILRAQNLDFAKEIADDVIYNYGIVSKSIILIKEIKILGIF